jgi:hypothetical protein
MIMKLLNPQPNFSYPLMRDPKKNPKCYELTDEERIDAVLRVEELLRDIREANTQGYYGA